MSYYQRRLPHWNPEDAAVFLTWRLFGSLPPSRSEWERLPAGKRFTAEDQALLHSAGPHFLNDDRVADCVAATFVYGAEKLHLYDLHAWVIMPNHVHILIRPHGPLPRITRSIKSYSARQANRVLDRSGRPFWQIESFGHWVRNRAEFESIVHYIEFNPVKAGLVAAPEEWRWSSAWKNAGREACATEVLHDA
jgi:REP element-mobilizing transposase RayT